MWPFDSETVSGTATVSHEALYKMVHDGPGPTPLSEAVQAWEQNIASRFQHVEQVIKETLDKVHAVWEGDASDQMQSGTQPLGTWAGEAADTSKQVAGAVQNQANDY